MTSSLSPAGCAPLIGRALGSLCRGFRPRRAPGLAAFLALLTLAMPLELGAQSVPQLLNYQGRVAVGGVNFSGFGQFKFALVNADGSQTYWSTDGTSTAGSQPAAAVTLTVANGLYSILLGDTTIPGMTAVPATAFANADVRLRVWFNDGVNGVQLLTPDQRIAAVGYALMADGVKAGGITGSMIAAGAVGSAQLASGAAAANIAPGSITSSQLGTGAAAANLAASGQSGVASGGLILSPTENPALLAAGYVRIGSTVLAESWQQRSNGAPAPSARTDHTVVWTGSEMIVWGGRTGNTCYNDGARFNPATNVWTAVPTAGAPTARAGHTAVWTGAEMIVWSGTNRQSSDYNDGGRYRLSNNTWSPLSTAGAPSTRYAATAVWTGTEMIVFGGYSDVTSARRSDAGRFNPSANSWAQLPTSGAPSPRNNHTSIWTGSEMIVWGGYDGSTYPAGGARYRPAGNIWTALPTTNAPAPRYFHTAIWTGAEMIVWGGTAGGYFNDGGRYNPTSNAWTALPATGAPAVRSDHTAVWTDREMVVWGGVNSISTLGDGARYDPATGTWIALSSAGAPLARRGHRAVWTGSEMLIWGSISDNPSYTPGRTMYLYQRP